MAGNGSKFIQAKVDELVFESFLAVVNLSGQSSIELAGEMIEEDTLRRLEKIAKLESDGEIDHDVLLVITYLRLRKQENRQQMLDEISARTDDGEMLDQVYESAIHLGLDPERSQSLSKNPVFKNVIESSRMGTKLGDCARWLAALIVKYQQLPLQEIRELARKTGYKNETLERAKRMCGLKSVKSNGQWYWTIPDMIEVVQEHDGSVKIVTKTAPTVSK